MAAFTPFEAAVKASVAGYTQTIVLGGGSGTSQTVQMNNPTATSVLVQAWNANAAGGAQISAYVRMSVESSTGIVSANSITDTPVIIPPQQAVVRLYASPNPAGIYNIAVIVSVTPSIAGSFISFTPGQGGIV